MSNNYLTDYLASSKLARKIQNYWHDRGYTGVHVFVEKDQHNNYVVRSNIELKVSDAGRQSTQ